MSSKLVTFDQFSAANLKASDLIPKEITKPNEKIKYNDIKLSYNYGTEQDPIIQDVFFEGCVVKGTSYKERKEEAMGKNGAYTKVSTSMMLTFDLSDADTKDDSLHCIEKLDEFYKGCRKIIAVNKGKLKMHDFTVDGPVGIFKDPVYWHLDEVSGERIKGKNPNIWVKFHSARYNKTLFTDLNGKPVEWSLLEGSEVTMVPLFHFEKIYVGSKISLQVYLSSAVVLKIVPIGTESRQLSTIERLKSKYGSSLADEVEAQLSEIRMTRQDTLASNASQGGGDFNNGTMHSMPPEQGEDDESLSDFLSAAPTMSAPAPAPVSVPTMSSKPIRLNVQARQM